MNTNGKKVVRELTGAEFLQRLKDSRIRIFEDGTIQVLGMNKTLEVISDTVIDASAKQQVDMLVGVTKLLHTLGVPANIKGYHYVRSAILLGIQDGSSLNSMTKVLYPKIADRYHSTATRVERAIRKAIEITWERGNIEVIQEIFGYTVDSCKRKPTNGEFISLIVDFLVIKYEL